MERLKHIEEASINAINTRWDCLEIKPRLVEILNAEFKFPSMTLVQAATIPLMLKNKDVIVEARTGSGKTLAFLIPTVELLIRLDQNVEIGSHDVLATILSPTRELATQIHQVLRKLLRNLQLKGDRRIVSQLIVAGPSVSMSIAKYRKYGGNILVATPGRLSALMEMTDNDLSLSIRKKLKYLILDEADQLLSLGFELNLSSIFNYLPKQRRTSLFSATQTKDVEDLIKSGLRNPIRVNVNQFDETVTKKSCQIDCVQDKSLMMPNNLSNFYCVCDSYLEKLAIMTTMVMYNEYKKVLVFLSTCSQVDYFSACLEPLFGAKRIALMKLHRRLKSKRKSIFNNFKKSKRCVLLATDILSRGIDITDISLVVHLDLPTSPECYVHRSGRSGHHIELSGISLLLLEKHELDYVEMCRRRQIKLEPMSVCHLSSDCSLLVDTLHENMHVKSIGDESFQTLGIQAFVSYIRFYSSKLCLRQILFPKLNIVNLAKSFGLVRLPKMPELRKNYKSLVDQFEQEIKKKAAASESNS